MSPTRAATRLCPIRPRGARRRASAPASARRSPSRCTRQSALSQRRPRTSRSRVRPAVSRRAPTVATTAISRDECTLPNGSKDVFYVPYIQTGSSLSVAASVVADALPPGGGVQFVLDQGQPSEQTAYSLSEPFQATFTGIGKGEHTLDASIVDSDRQAQSGPGDHDSATRIGVGDIIVAIGDSVTEGYDGTAWNVSPYTSWLDAPVSSAGRAQLPAVRDRHRGIEGPLAGGEPPGRARQRARAVHRLPGLHPQRGRRRVHLRRLSRPVSPTRPGSHGSRPCTRTGG